MRASAMLLLAALLAGCSRRSDLPTGISVKNGIVLLEEGAAITIRQNQKSPRTVLVGNLEGKLSVTQLEDGGHTPHSMDLISPDRTSTCVMRGTGPNLLVILDQDGDGIPDLKVEGSKRFKLSNIEWSEIHHQP